MKGLRRKNELNKREKSIIRDEKDKGRGRTL